MLTCSLYAQQDVLSTQFMYNKLAVNPAFSGRNEATTITGILRDQWTGLKGAPKSQALSINLKPLGKVGLGLNIARQTVGVSEKLSLEGLYSYGFKIGTGTFSMGMSFSARHFEQDFTDPNLIIIHDIKEDPALSYGIYTTNIFNVGFGLYYSGNRFFAGASVPRLIKSEIDFKAGSIKSTEVRHIYVMTGGALDFSRKLIFMPQLLFRYAENAPYDLDLNLGLLLNDRFYAGTTFRTGGAYGNWFESVDFLLGLYVTKNLFLSTSYDVTLTPLREFENGSLEVLLQYKFGKTSNPVDIINPRFF